MKGIYIINERWQEKELTKEQSIDVQMNALQTYIKESQISTLKLNPSQLNDYYTIPHALLYDLRKQSDIHLDCLVLYSEEVIADFIYAYPARWILLKSYFDKVVFVEQHYKDVAI